MGCATNLRRKAEREMCDEKIKTYTCKYCGKKTEYKSWENFRGEDRNNFEGCKCELYRVKQKVKPMCYNCKHRGLDDIHYLKGYCKNDEMKKEISDKFIIATLAIKDEFKHCSHWEPMDGLFNNFVPDLVR